MYAVNQLFANLLSAARSRKAQVAIMVLAIALFVFAAGAPNATVGIGK